MSKYSDFINSLTCIDGVVCHEVSEQGPNSIEFYGKYYEPVKGFGLLADDMVKGDFYMSTAFDTPVKLLEIEKPGTLADGGALVTVLWRGGIYYDSSFRMAKYNKAS